MSRNAVVSRRQLSLRVSLSTLRFATLTFVLALPMLPSPAQAQTIDCYASLEAYKLSNPELHCTCASATSSPSCGGSSVSHGSHTLTTKQMMQQEIATTVVSAFINMLFSNDSQANAQKQKMMAELQARQLAAERQKQHEEALRLAAICQRLQGTLKMSGTPTLKPKSEAASTGLKLKLGEGDGHVGVPGLPGIALNDNTGSGGSAPYGIAGLPGIYTNGPASTTTSSRDHSATGGLTLKLGEGPSVAQIAPQPTTALTTTVTQSVALPDPRTMTPQQLADLAANLSPEQQQQLANAMQTAQAQSATATTSTDTGPVVQPPTDANTPALGQLQQTAAASKAAAHATKPEDMAAGARVGFDQAATAATTPASQAVAGTQGTGQTGPQTANATSTSATHPKPPAAPSSPVVDLAVLRPPTAIADVPTGPNLPPDSKPQCITRTEHQLPSRQELLTELAQRRTELENLRRTIMRLNRSIQMDQKQFETWQAEAEAGHERVVNRIFSLPTKLALDSFIELKEAQFAAKKGKGLLNAADMRQIGMLERAKDLKTFDDFQKWVLEEKTDNEMYEEGMRQIIGILPFGPEVKSYINCAQDLIDNAYDLVDLVNTWNNVQQLDHNSDRFLLGVKGNGLRMKSLLTRIQQIESQLNGTPQNVRLEYCSR